MSALDNPPKRGRLLWTSPFYAGGSQLKPHCDSCCFLQLRSKQKMIHPYLLKDFFIYFCTVFIVLPFVMLYVRRNFFSSVHH